MKSSLNPTSFLTLHGHHGRQLPNILTREEVPVQCWTATKASSSDNSHETTTVFFNFLSNSCWEKSSIKNEDMTNNDVDLDGMYV